MIIDAIVLLGILLFCFALRGFLSASYKPPRYNKQ